MLDTTVLALGADGRCKALTYWMLDITVQALGVDGRCKALTYWTPFAELAHTSRQAVVPLAVVDVVALLAGHTHVAEVEVARIGCIVVVVMGTGLVQAGRVAVLVPVEHIDSVLVDHMAAEVAGRRMATERTGLVGPVAVAVA
tara:strand:- start:5682 stop:6110 length:429 start_codon:yes stop_codon:yes gene_type:complete